MKGGALVYSILKDESRPTLDIDLLANNIKANQENLAIIFREIAKIESSDGVTFDADKITTIVIVKDGDYSGVRVKMLVNLGNIRQTLQVDIGIGDVVTPAAVEMTYPTILDFESPKLLSYSVETLIAEKFEAMINLGEYNSRMKDFYDVYTFLKTEKFDKDILTEAISNTFQKRKTKLSMNAAIFKIAFAEDANRRKQWKAFLKKSQLDMSLDFTVVMAKICDELK